MATNSYLGMAMRDLYDMGILDILLPFILIFTIIFAVLQRTKVLGKDDDGKPMKNFNVVISLVMALSAVIPHVLWGTGDPNHPYLANGFLDVVQVINNALPSVSLIVVAVLMFLIIIGIWGKNVDIGGTSLGGIITLVSIVGIAFIFAVAAGWRARYWPDFLVDPQTQALVVVVLVFGLIIRFITGPSDKNKDKDKNNWAKKISESLKDTD
ncbi:hypothetical protein KY327_00565 [Candidatus Woesearchaeota archaeon]|nr:hypothetical protein [Candidatus Woesearchaeota archaeon]